MQSVYTLEELKKISPVFNSFATIRDCNIPEYYKGIFPHTCKCGAEMIMTEPAHTQLQCCNPGCWVKMAHRLAYFISYLGYEQFGVQSALSLFKASHDKMRYSTFLSAFLLSPAEMSVGLTNNATGILLDIRDDLQHKSFHFVDAISALGIPNIGSRSTLFSVVKSSVVLLDYSLKNNTDALCDAAGIQAPMTRFWLANSKLDFVTLMKDVMPNIMDTPKTEICVAITGRVSVGGKYYTRYEFIALCESIKDANGVQSYKLIETKDQSRLEFVIADEPSTSSKYTLGKKLGILVTAVDFYSELVRRAEGNVFKKADIINNGSESTDG